jgi:hypothetical protein
MSVDLSKWDSFTNAWTDYTALLKEKGFRSFLQNKPTAFDRYTDIDSNVDIVTLLTSIPLIFKADEDLSRASDALIRQIGYPESVSQWNLETIRLDPEKGSRFEVHIPADPHLPEKIVLDNMISRLKMANSDLELPDHFKFSIVQFSSGHEDKKKEPWFVISGKLKSALPIRPWLPGVRTVKIGYTEGRNEITEWETLKREKDFIFVDSFPDESLILSEAHTQGLPFAHGLGILMKPLMNNTEERSLDPLTGLAGPDMYRSLEWNLKTGWGDLTLLN